MTKQIRTVCVLKLLPDVSSVNF